MSKGKGNSAGYVGDAFKAVEADVKGLKTAVTAVRKENDRRGSTLDEAGRYLDQSEDPSVTKPDYTVSSAVARKVGKDNAVTLRRIGSALRAKSKLEEQVEAAGKATERSEFAEKRIDELNKAPYTELDEARVAGKGSDVYKALVESTKYEGEETRATYWVEQQIAQRDELEKIRADVQAETKRNKDYLKPPKPKGDKGNGSNGGNGGKKEGNGNGKKPRRRPGRK
jgi:hypothetical protein